MAYATSKIKQRLRVVRGVDHLQRPMDKDHRAPVLHMQRENVWRLGEVLRGRWVETKVLRQFNVPLVEQLLDACELRLAESGRANGVDSLHGHAEQNGCGDPLAMQNEDMQQKVTYKV